jgi:DNA-directed RNA polymerase specialized sigma subunit
MSQEKQEETQLLTENEQKKEYLRSYREHVKRIDRIEAELLELRSMRVSVSINNDGMPHAHNVTDLSGYAAELDELERKLLEERYQSIMAYKDIVRRIKRLRSENELDVLFYRYIKGMDWWEIADRMNYSERWVHKIHGKALAHFQMPKKRKEFIEVQ